MRYLYLHSAHPEVARVRGLQVFQDWRGQDRQVYLSSKLGAGVWEFAQAGNNLILVDLPGVEPWTRFVEEAAALPNVVLVDVHHPIWRPDLQAYLGDEVAGRSHWNLPATINLVERSLRAAEAVITPRFVWGNPEQGQEHYNQLPDLMRFNHHIHEIEDVRSDDDLGLFEVELEMAFKDGARRKGLA